MPKKLNNFLLFNKISYPGRRNKVGIVHIELFVFIYLYLKFTVYSNRQQICSDSQLQRLTRHHHQPTLCLSTCSRRHRRLERHSNRTEYTQSALTKDSPSQYHILLVSNLTLLLNLPASCFPTFNYNYCLGVITVGPGGPGQIGSLCVSTVHVIN